jgi:hypothetical protein
LNDEDSGGWRIGLRTLSSWHENAGDRLPEESRDMYRKMILALAAVAAIGLAGMPLSASAHGGCRGGYYGGYAGYGSGYHRAYYGGYSGYRGYGGYGYGYGGPIAVRSYYGPGYGAYYGGGFGYGGYPGYYGRGVGFAIGF